MFFFLMAIALKLDQSLKYVKNLPSDKTMVAKMCRAANIFEFILMLADAKMLNKQ